MNTKILSAALLFLLFTAIAFAQEDQSFKTITVVSDKDSVFNKTIDYLMAQDLFIQSVDKQAGFIQAKVFIKDKKILSAKVGERRTMSFILRQADHKTTITLNIYGEDYRFSADISSRSYYYEDKGIIDNAAVYRDVLGGLQKVIR